MLGMGLGGGLVMVLFWVALIGGAAWLAGALFNGSRPAATSGREASAREILDQRFAHGEITREKYDLMKRDLH